VETIGQNGNGNYRLWNQRSLNGAVGLRANFIKQQQIFKGGEEENLKGALFSGRFLLESRSYVVHPNLMDLGIELEYNPEKIDDQYLVSPDRSEVRSLKRLNINSTFFQEKEISVNGFVNLNQNYITRENLANVRTNRKFFGGGIYYKNMKLPVSVTYQEGNWDQEEIATDRVYTYWQRNIKGRISKSFFSSDKHVLTYAYDDFIRKEYYTTPRQSVINDVKLNSSIFFDTKRAYKLSSIISLLDQGGSDEFSRFQVLENLRMDLPYNLKFTGNYNFFDHRNPLYRLNQHQVNLNLGHQLFSSLQTNVFTEYVYNKHTVYQQYDFKAGFNIKYIKKIPKGQLSISYYFLNKHFQKNNESFTLEVMNEEHILSDGQITLLNESFIEIESVVVKDITGTIIYQLNFDYILIEQNNYIEIQRIPGGQIPNNTTILVDYSTFLLPGANKYKMNNQILMFNVLLFDRIVELYYRRSKQDYDNLVQTELTSLNYYSQNVYGLRFLVKFARFGVEYDVYKSTIVPYKLIRYFADLQWKFRYRLLLSLTGNIRDYVVIGNRSNELYADVSGRLAYSFSPELKLNMELTYRDQKGYQIDLELLTARAELMMKYRNLFMRTGIDFYRRDFLNSETLNFNGVFISIERKF